MDEFPFCQPVGSIIQMAYSVPDLRAGMEWWTEQLGVGPWFVFDRIGGLGVTYRDDPSEAEFAIALGYSGHMMIELVQTLDDLPSVHGEVRERRGYGFHHVARAVPNLREEVAARLARGFTVVHRALVPGGEVYILDAGDDAPGMLEFIEDNAVTRQLFTAIWRASLDWDGSNTRRDFGEALAAAKAEEKSISGELTS